MKKIIKVYFYEQTHVYKNFVHQTIEQTLSSKPLHIFHSFRLMKGEKILRIYLFESWKNIWVQRHWNSMYTQLVPFVWGLTWKQDSDLYIFISLSWIYSATGCTAEKICFLQLFFSLSFTLCVCPRTHIMFLSFYYSYTNTRRVSEVENYVMFINKFH